MRKETKKSISEGMKMIIELFRFILLSFLSLLIWIGRMSWSVSKMSVAENLIVSWLFVVVYSMLLFLLIYLVFTHKYYSLLQACSSLILIVVSISTNPSPLLTLSYILFGIGQIGVISEKLFDFDFGLYINKTINKIIKNHRRKNGIRY